MHSAAKFDRQIPDEEHLAQTFDHLSGSGTVGGPDLLPGSRIARTTSRRWQLDHTGFSRPDLLDVRHGARDSPHREFDCCSVISQTRVVAHSRCFDPALRDSVRHRRFRLRESCGVLAISNEHRALMESRKPLMNVLELKEWSYFPDENHPTQIRISVVVHQPGRFAAGVTGQQTNPSGDFTTIFQSTNGPESQRQVSGEESFTYAFPLQFLNVGQANDVRVTLYLFKAPSGPAPGDIAKVFMKSPQQEDDGEYFYGVLPLPSQPAK